MHIYISLFQQCDSINVIRYVSVLYLLNKTVNRVINVREFVHDFAWRHTVPVRFPGAISIHKQTSKSDITKVCTKQFQGISGTKLRFQETRTGAEILVKLMS